jgi:hypothetical protein
MNTRDLVCAAVAALMLSLGLATGAAGDPATPQRPTYSSDPNTTAPGTLELEAGYLYADDETADLPLTLKWGSGKNTELFLGWSPWFRTPDSSEYIGDTVLGVRHRFVDATQGPVALAYQVAAKVPTSDPDDGSGSGAVDAFFALTSAWSMGRFSGVGYYQFGALGRPANDGVLAENALALVVGTPLSGRWAIFAEWSSRWRPELRSFDSLALLGTAFSPRPALALDAAASYGMVPGEDFWTVTVGATVNFGWPRGEFR